VALDQTAMNGRRFPPPWTVEQQEAWFVGRATSGDGLTDELKRQAAFRWLGDEAEAQRLQQEQTYHYVRWTFLVAVAAVIAGLIAVGLARY
jgi:hypothetical protein